MDEIYLAKEIGPNRLLCLAPLTNRQLACADQDVPDPSGHYLFEQFSSGEWLQVRIIARVMSDALDEFRDAFGLA